MTENELILACQAIGVHVVFLPLRGVAGGYVHELRLIIVDSTLPPSQQRAVLAHEYVHALCGHEGVQDQGTEAWVDCRAARLLVSPVEYALAERFYGGDVVAIAEELDVAVWVVVAYREWLALCGGRDTKEFSPPLD